jgi:hypothetical protein
MKNKQMPISARRNRLAALVSVCTLAAGAVFAGAPAFAASGWPCNNTGAGIAAASGRVKGTGTWTCSGVGLPATFGAEVHLFHDYAFLPDPEIAYGQWILPGIVGSQSKSVQRCDQGTTADYYAQAQIPAYQSSPWATSGLLKITTCLGTGS